MMSMTSFSCMGGSNAYTYHIQKKLYLKDQEKPFFEETKTLDKLIKLSETPTTSSTNNAVID